MSKKRPHIIIFNPDQMRADALGHLGNPASVTPNLDRFIKEGAVSFANAYCQNPVCVPSRCSFFTGLYPHVRGHRTMSYLLRPGEDSLLKELKENGYYVWMNDRNDLTAGQLEEWTKSHADEIYYSGQVKGAPGPLKEMRGEPGSKNYYSHFEGKLKLDKDDRNYNGDDEVVDAAIYRLRNPVDERPVCIFMGLFYPHPPYHVEEPYYSAIDRTRLPQRIIPEECEGKAKILETIRSHQGMEEYTEDDWNELRSVYLGMCMKVDAQFGKLIHALKELKIYDDCAIFFLSDHGDFTGDYGLVEKCQNSFEDCLTRVPLLIKPSKNIPCQPGISKAMTELVDFYATVMDIADVRPNHTHFGKSLLPVLADPSAVHREWVFCEGGRMPGERHCDEYHEFGENGPSTAIPYWPKLIAQTDDDAHAKGIMMRSSKYKYISRSVGKDEFYDLEKDPDERKNRIDEKEYIKVIQEAQGIMLKWLQGTCDIVPYEYDHRFTKEMTWARIRHIVSEADKYTVKKMIEEGKGLLEIKQFCMRRETQNKRGTENE